MSVRVYILCVRVYVCVFLPLPKFPAHLVRVRNAFRKSIAPNQLMKPIAF